MCFSLEKQHIKECIIIAVLHVLPGPAVRVRGRDP